jgi:hypothetical protein
MFQNKSCDELIRLFRERLKIIAPDEDSVIVTRDLWKEWSKSGIAPPDIEAIANTYAQHENGFFYELVKLAESQAGHELVIHFCQFTSNRYNAHALTAADGYIIFVDDVFFQVLFFLCNILVFDAHGALSDPTEREHTRQFFQRIIQTNYINRERIDFSQETRIIDVMKKDYELAEFANYFFHSIKAFIIAHEIGHHVLGHTRGAVSRVFSVSNTIIEAEVDNRQLEMEYDADKYGYVLFTTLSHTVDESVYYAYCKYRFPFAPVLLFDLFNKLEEIPLREGEHLSDDHPKPADRAKALKATYAIDLDDPLYLALKDSLNYFFAR